MDELSAIGDELINFAKWLYERLDIEAAAKFELVMGQMNYLVIGLQGRK
jgi:hypothetical protein